MTFTITIDGFCSGNHVNFTVHIGGRNVPVVATRDELLADLPNLEDAVQQRIKSFCLENWAGNWNNLRTAIEATTFKV